MTSLTTKIEPSISYSCLLSCFKELQLVSFIYYKSDLWEFMQCIPTYLCGLSNLRKLDSVQYFGHFCLVMCPLQTNSEAKDAVFLVVLNIPVHKL